MKTEKDFSYLSEKDKSLIKMGYAELGVYQLRFGQDTTLDWSRMDFQEDMTEYLNNQLLPFEKYFVANYHVQQLNTESNDSELFWWSNRGWNGKEVYDTFSVTIGLKSGKFDLVDTNNELFEKIVKDVETISAENVVCKIQYKAFVDQRRVRVDADQLYKELLDISRNEVNIDGMRLKLVGTSFDGSPKFGLFKKYAKKKYVPVSDEEFLVSFKNRLSLQEDKECSRKLSLI